ncbi:angiotensin-converting enzyme-like isoform X2 [Prorops nasuta]|uniref:angiotensin-converting enzyme-like isoform X2 n=1 Tax=Prorops nasuta TaxID=863751 RepID=UPI0034CFC624
MTIEATLALLNILILFSDVNCSLRNTNCCKSRELDEKNRWDSKLIIDEINNDLEKFNRVSARLEWESNVDPSEKNFLMSQNLAELKTVWKNDWCERLTYPRSRGEPLRNLIFNEDQRRMIKLLCRGAKYNLPLIRETFNVKNQIASIYANTKICRQEGGIEKCYNGEPDLARLMASSRNESELRWAWTMWRNKMSGVKNLFTTLVDLQNIAANENGYEDVGESWREALDLPDLESFVDNIYEKIKPLYRLLHGVLRFRLAKIYPGIIDISRPIPAHLLGNLWMQNWDTLIDVVFPNYLTSVPNVAEEMKRKNYTVHSMVKEAEEFFKSLGFPPLPSEFWRNSIFEKNNSQMSCHPMAANMFSNNDYRILACLKPRRDDLEIIYHELGHVQYFMAYQNQSTLFRNGINEAFHEAIGDSVTYGATSFQNLLRLDLVKFKEPHNSINHTQRQALFLTELLRRGLAKLPLFATGLAMEKWRWLVFQGKIKPSDYNVAWWELHQRYAGISPPTPRYEEFFDPPAKFQVANNIPYASYFLANLLQIQLYQGMCEAAVTGKVGNINFKLPLDHCDIYGSIAAGKRLRSIMRLGSSVNWTYAMRAATGYSKYLVEPLLKYYERVRRWLQKEVNENDIPLGWD